MNIAEIGLSLAELVAKPFDGAEFPFAFAEIHHAPKATLTKLRNSSDGKQDLFGGFLWKKKFYFQPADKGQAAETLEELKARKFARTENPRFLISTDGEEFSAIDRKADETLHCPYDEIGDRFDFFLPLAGVDKFEAIEENPADMKAAGKLARFHDEIIRANPDWAKENKRHELNLFMTRILFCLYAEDTGIIPENLFSKTVTEWGGQDGSSLRIVIKQIFDVMNVHEDDRKGGAKHINAFPFVNGGLFAEQTETPSFSKRATRYMLEASELDWREINPDIFGSMIQAVVDEEMRGDLGMHYTSVPNIMKVLQPLFLMSLEEELAEAHGHREERSMLKKLRNRISKIRVFDPACGSGNFLIIAYRELRQIEMRIFQREDEIEGGQTAVRWESGVKLSNFFGIEYADFAAETAKLSLWIAEYQMNVRFKEMFGEAPSPLPLTEGGTIVHGNALRENWFEVCPPPMKAVNKEKVFDLATVVQVHGKEFVVDEEVETFICGNPPYLGTKYQSDEQKSDLKFVFDSKVKKFGNLDYVAGWYFKAGEYSAKIRSAAAFVATNSICQGEQVALLWPALFELKTEISFAHLSFKWRNLAAKNAGVTCVIVGLRPVSNSPKKIFSGEQSRIVSNISPYLTEGLNTVVKKSRTPMNGLPEMDFGSMANDDGNLLLSRDEMESLIANNPETKKLIKRIFGGQELIKGIERYCLWIDDSELNFAQSIPEISDRIENTRLARLKSKRPATQRLAREPHRFGEVRYQNADKILIPQISSDKREWFACGFLDQDSVVIAPSLVINSPAPFVFSLISSKLHSVWVKAVCGQLETRVRYSNLLGYNTFPLPTLSAENIEALERHTWNIISARNDAIGKTISFLYDPKTMPEELKEAHIALDNELEKIYIGRPFKDDNERLEHLFKMYPELTAKTDKKKARANA